MKWHPSTLGKLMAAPKTKSEVLSETAKSEIRKIAKEQFFGFSSSITTKPMIKGKDWEEESIALVNQVRGTLYVKNKERFENEFLTGEPDIIEDDPLAADDSAADPADGLERFTVRLTREQFDAVRGALDAAARLGPFVDSGNDDADGNALARVCEMFRG